MMEQLDKISIEDLCLKAHGAGVDSEARQRLDFHDLKRDAQMDDMPIAAGPQEIRRAGTHLRQHPRHHPATRRSSVCPNCRKPTAARPN